jgi:MOSC domain-containing protein YiiM
VSDGRIIGIAVRERSRAPMCELARVQVTRAGGLDGDCKGVKFPRRQVTILAREDWQQACDALADLAGPVPLPWIVRRANLLVEGLRLPRAKGAILRVGDVRLEVTAQTYPCGRMEQAQPGLLKALAADWRGGVTCRVLDDGVIRIGDRIEVEHAPREAIVRLP